MRRFIMAAAVVPLVAFPAAFGSVSDADAPAASTQATTPTPQPLRNGCQQLYTRSQFKHYAVAVYHRSVITRKARIKIREMTKCQQSDAAEKWAHKKIVRLKRQRWRRLHPWEYARSKLSAGTRAMLDRLGGCETRGLAYPENYQIGPGHPRWNGHDGRYQYAPSTWQRAGGSGRANQASPAEQDVRTARFYPSHRGEWACSA